MSKINIVRSIKTKNIRDDANHNREMGWDNRFHLAKLQPYDAYQDAYFVNMRILRDQFKVMEQSYHKPGGKGNSILIDRKFRASANHRNSEYGSTNFGNSGMINNINLPGSYNNFYNGNTNNPNIYISENPSNDPFNEEYNTIVSLWEDLGVTENYTAIFENLSIDIDPLMKKDLFESEITSLRKFSDLLFKISKEIESREQLIVKIHVINETFLSSTDKKESILTELVQNLKNIRITSINIINYLQKIRELCSYNVLGGKFNLDKINKVYKFDKNYLIKMKFDMDFLRNSKLATFFEFEPCESDPFLLYFYFKDEKLEKIHSMQISEEMLSAVRQGQYLILQDLIFFNINSIYMKNLQRQEKTLGKIKGIYGRDFSNPQRREVRNSGATSSRLYSPPKKNIGINGFNNLNNNFNDLRPSTSGYNNFAKNPNPPSVSQFENHRTNRRDNENNFQATTNNFFKASNLTNNKSEKAKKSPIGKEQDLQKPGTADKQIQNTIDKTETDNNTNNINNYNPINKNINNVKNQADHLNYNNIQSEFLNPIQLQNQRGLSVNSKDNKDVNVFLPNQINPNLNIINNPNNNFYDPYHHQMNLYPNQPQVHPMAYNFPPAYGYGFHPSMPMGFPVHPHLYTFNTSSHGFMPAVANQSQPVNVIGSYAKDNLMVSSMAKIEIIPNINVNNANANSNNNTLKKQNTDRSHDNSKVIKIKSEEIIAIDKKDNYNINAKKSVNTNNKKVNENSNLSIKTDENEYENSINNNKKEKEKEKLKQNKEKCADESYGHNSSRFTKKIEEDLSIQDEIDLKRIEKKSTQKSLKKVNLKDSESNSNKNENNYNNSNNNFVKKNISIKKTESDIQEEENSQLILDKFHSRKSLLEQQQKHTNHDINTNNDYNNQSRSYKMQNSIDEEIQSEKDFKNVSKRMPTDKSAKYEDSFNKKSLHSNLSEKSYKASKKSGKKDIITNFDYLNNNKENSIDELIDSKSLKDIENEIDSDFKNDQPVIEESKKTTGIKELSPKNLTSHASRVATEMKYEKLEVINEESVIEKSKSHLREGVVGSGNKHKGNLNGSVEGKQAQLQQQNSDIEEDYEKYNNFEENECLNKGSENDVVIKNQKGGNKEHYNNNNSHVIDQNVVDYNDNNHSRNNNDNFNSKVNYSGFYKGEENKENAHETFDSLKTNKIKSHKGVNEEIIDIENKNITNVSKEHIEERLADVIKTEENYNFEDQKIGETEHSKISEYSTLSKKNKAAGLKSHKLFEELKEKTLNFCKDEFVHIKTEEPLEKIDIENKEDKGIQDENNYIHNESILKAEEAKPLDNSQNQIIPEEQIEKNYDLNNNKNEYNDFVQESEGKNLTEENRKQTGDIKEENFLIINENYKLEPEVETQLAEKTEENQINNTTNNKINDEINDEIQEENFGDKNYDDANVNRSLNDKKLETELDKNVVEEEINFKAKSNSIKKTDPDGIKEDNSLAEAKNDEINKSLKSKNSDLEFENKSQTNEPANAPEEQEIIEEAIQEVKKQQSKELLPSNHNDQEENEAREQEEKLEDITEYLNKNTKNKRIFNSLKSHIKVSFLTNTEQISQFDLEYQEYIEKLNESQKITFKPRDSITDYLTGFNPKIIKISNEANDLIGLCCISFDNSWEDSVKININHLSALEFEFFEDFGKMFLDFIKENFAADEILIDLHYEFKDSKFEINTAIRDVFKNSFKFKWNKLENRDGERIQKMALTLESTSNDKRSQISKLMNSTLEVNYFSVLHLVQNNEVNNENNVDPTKQENNNNNDLTHLNYFSLVSSLCQLHGGKNNVKSEMLEKYEKDKIKRLCRKFIVSVNPEDELDKEKYETNKLYLPEGISNEFQSSGVNNKNLSIMKLNLKFSTFSSYKLDEFIYNRIQGSISTLINEEINHEFHVILTSDGNYTVLITELNKGLKEFLELNKNENIYKLFDGLYNSLKNTHSEEEATQANTRKSIWIPSFSSNWESTFAIDSNNSQDENEHNLFFKEEIKSTYIEDKQNGEQRNIQKINQAYNSIFRFDGEYRNNPNVIPNEKDIFIKDSFLISIINLDILADSHISTVFLSVVDKDKWIKSI